VEDLFLLLTEPLFDVAAHLFGEALNLTGFQLDASITAQIFSRLLEGGLTAGPGHQSTHPRRIGSVNDVQSLVIRETALMALLALKKGPEEGKAAQGGY